MSVRAAQYFVIKFKLYCFSSVRYFLDASGTRAMRVLCHDTSLCNEVCWYSSYQPL